jgi:hypothetical protein
LSKILLTAATAPMIALTACGAASEATPRATAPPGVVEQYDTLAAEVAERGGSKRVGEWTVSYIVEAAEPWHEGHGGDSHFREPAAGETHHIEIIPTETATGRIVPEVPVTLHVLDERGDVVDSSRLNFYYSTFYHYANNFSIPAEGRYTLRATLGRPAFLRHGEKSEAPALDEGADLSFEGVELTQG